MVTLLDNSQWDKDALLDKMYDDDFYYGHLGKYALSSSAVKILNKSPKHYKFVTQYGQKSNTNLEVGNFVHTMILEPHTFEDRFHIVDCQSRNAKTFKDAKVHLSKIVLTKKEYNDNMRVVDAALRNEEVLQIIQGCEFEIPAVGMINGLPFRAKADILHQEFSFMADLKTTSDVHAFRYSADKYGYDAQAYIYSTLFNVPFTQFKFVAVDKGSLDIGIFTVTEDFIARGKQKVDEACDIYRKFFIMGEDIDSYTLHGEL